MKVFNIYHAVGPDKFTETEDQIRIYAGHVEAMSLEQAFIRSQNLEFYWNAESPCRSTSIGDVIETNGKFHMVCSTGFRLLVEEQPQNEVDPSDYVYAE